MRLALLSLGCTSLLQPGAIQGKEGIQFCHLATLVEGETSEKCLEGTKRARKRECGADELGHGTEGRDGPTEDGAQGNSPYTKSTQFWDFSSPSFVYKRNLPAEFAHVFGNIMNLPIALRTRTPYMEAPKWDWGRRSF